MNAINYRIPWTLEAEQELIRRHAAGETDQQIADGMGRTRVAIINKRSALGISHGQQCGFKRMKAIEFMFSEYRYENITKAEAKAIREWALCPDHEYPNINLLNLTALPKPPKP